jgi:hypothetical protein
VIEGECLHFGEAAFCQGLGISEVVVDYMSDVVPRTKVPRSGQAAFLMAPIEVMLLSSSIFANVPRYNFCICGMSDLGSPSIDAI